MTKAAAMSLAGVVGDLLTVQPISAGLRAEERQPASGWSASGPRSFVVQAKDDATSSLLLAALQMFDRMLVEKTAAVRERRLQEMVDFMAERLVTTSPSEMEMAQRLANRHARVLNEFGWYTAEQLAQANRSQASVKSALADNWRKRRQVFAVPHPDKTARERDVYPAFQFDNFKPIKAMHEIIEAFGDAKAPWKLALWMTSANGLLPGSARPVDLLGSAPEQVIAAARSDASGSAV